MSIIVKQLTYIHPDREVLFQNISFSVESGQKVGLVGNNGSGKSTLLQIMRRNLSPSSGEIVYSDMPYYVPQHFGQYNERSVAEALLVDLKLKALHAILEGDASENNFAILNDDWNIEERVNMALSLWGLEHVSLSHPLKDLSGGEKTRVFLAGISVHDPKVILMDEPSNHLDFESRDKLYEMIESERATMLVVSHDRRLLNMLPAIYELGKSDITYYAGNYDFFRAEKEHTLASMQEKLTDKEKELRMARKVARETIERKQKHESRGKKLNMKKGVGKIAMDTLQDRAEKSRSKLKDVHGEKMDSISENLTEMRAALPDIKSMKVDFGTSDLHLGKILVTGKDINFSYGDRILWENDLNFQIKSGERILIKGQNGSGKTTLLKLITKTEDPTRGVLESADFGYIYLDQEYSIVKDQLTVFEQVEQFNSGLLEHEIKIILNRFLFSRHTWDKPCAKLSGGEKMKLTLCCLMIAANTPDMFILDEPTNNIDIQNVTILMETIKDYKGTVLLISHDEYFVDEVGIDYTIDLNI